MAYVAVSTAIAMFLQIFQCMPVPSSWESWTGEFGSYQCLNINLMGFVVASNLILQDVVILLLPLPLLLQLNMSWKKRAGITIMFSLGIFVVIISSVRLQYLVALAQTTNPTYDYTDVIIWTGLEVDISVIVACLPAIRSYLSTRIKLFGSSNGGSGRPTMYPSDRLAASSKNTMVTRRSSHMRLPDSSSNVADVDTDQESQIELGDKVLGSTKINIGATKLTPEKRSNSSDGIYVKTTIRTSAKNPWPRNGHHQEAKGSPTDL
jgi:hypothetical protein